MSLQTRFYADNPAGDVTRVEPRQIQHSPTEEKPGLWAGASPVRLIKYRATGVPHVCDVACQTATRPLCECVCGGRNHSRFRYTPPKIATVQKELPL